MNKKEFLDYLSGRLSLLNAKEREDIIQEYSQHIDMKLEAGLTEYEAIKEFGEPKAFADEILEAYNIDPGYREEKPIGHNPLKGITTAIGSGVEFILSLSPRTVMALLIRILVMAVVLCIVGAFGFVVILELLDSVFMLSHSLTSVLLFLYLAVVVAMGIYVLCVYVKRLAREIRTGAFPVNKGLFSRLKAGVATFADFIVTQRPRALIKMLFKIFMMGVLVFAVGLAGSVIPLALGLIVGYIVHIEELLYALYILVALPVGVYVLICYTADLAGSMTRAQLPEEAVNKVSGFTALRKDREVESLSPFKIIGLVAGFIGRLVGRIIALGLKAFSVFCLFMVGCILLFTVFATGTALVFMLQGYPSLGIFITGIGACISLAAISGLIVKLCFKTKVREEGI